MSFDHGELNIPLQKRYGRGGIDAAIDRYKAEQMREKAREERRKIDERRAAREAEKARVKFTADDLVDARLVRDETGWVRVVRVNASTVTVGYALGEYRVPIDKIRDFKT